ncbi:KH homology domain-containing protein 1 [Lemmus lemmus]
MLHCATHRLGPGEVHIWPKRLIYLRHIEEHTNTFIQLEQWFTASGQTRVTVVGPLRVKQWLEDMFRGMGSENPYLHMLGLSMLWHVQE